MRSECKPRVSRSQGRCSRPPLARHDGGRVQFQSPNIDVLRIVNCCAHRCGLAYQIPITQTGLFHLSQAVAEHESRGQLVVATVAKRRS